MAIDPIYIQGVLKIMDIFLALVAGVLVIKLYLKAKGNDSFKPWKYLSIALLIFAFGEIMGTLDAFGILNFRQFLSGIELGVIIFFLIALFFKLRQIEGVNT